MDLAGIDHVAISVTDLERSLRWYVEVFGFERRYEEVWGDSPVFLCRGSTGLALFADSAIAPSPSHGPRMLHLAFRTDRAGFLAAQKELKDRAIPFRFDDHEISHSIYFHDPDGYRLEITTYDVKV